MPIRPIVAMIAVTASATGSSAATSAPNAISRMPRATGTADSSAFLKSSPKASSNVLFMLAPPISSIRSSEWFFWTSATAFSTGSTRSPAVSASPRMSNWTSALRPSFERVSVSYGDWTSVTLPVPSTAFDDVGDGRPERGVRGPDARVLRLDEDGLARGFVDPGVLDDPGGRVGLATELVALLDLDTAGRRAEAHRQDDEQHPDPDGRPAMLGAPAAGPGGYAPYPRFSVPHDGLAPS